MSRISAALAAAFGSDPVPIFALAQFEFDSGTVRLSTLTRDITWNGFTWSGAGGLLGFNLPSETVEVRATGGSIELNGIDPSYLAIADTENFQGRPVTVYIGAFDAAGAVVVDPDNAFRGLIDTMETEDDADTARIAVAVESRAAAFDRPNERRLTPEDQELRYAGDKAFDFVVALADKSIQWGPAA